MKRNWKHILGIASLAIAFFTSGCGEDFKEVPLSTIEDEAKESQAATAVSWWYLGERDGYHYLMIKRPLDEHRYKVKTTDLVLDLNQKELTFEESEWVNLKFGQMRFEHQE